ncbi:MAG: amidohydrolase family protein, partial [Aggregatilineales bacterium]
LRGKNFVEWIKNDLNDATKIREHDWQHTTIRAIEAGIEQLINAGITTVGDISATGLSIEPLMNSGLRGIVYIELLGTNPTQLQSRFHDVRELIEKWRPRERADGIQIGLSFHAPYSVHPELWRIGLEYAEKETLPLCIHVSESPDEYEFFMQGTGKLIKKYYSDDFPAIESPHMSPVAYLDEIGALAQKPLLVHAVQVDDDDIARIKNSGATIVHCPRSNLRLQCGRMPLEKYLAADIPVLIGSDSLASVPTLNVFDDIEFAVALHHEQVDPGTLMMMAHGTLPGYKS